MGGEGGQRALLLGLARLGCGEMKLLGSLAPRIQASGLQKEGFPGTGGVPMGGMGLEGTPRSLSPRREGGALPCAAQEARCHVAVGRVVLGGGLLFVSQLDLIYNTCTGSAVSSQLEGKITKSQFLVSLDLSKCGRKEGLTLAQRVAYPPPPPALPFLVWQEPGWDTALWTGWHHCPCAPGQGAAACPQPTEQSPWTGQ